MNPAPTTISAVLPVHNGAAHVADALASIRAQTYPVHELIVVDDGSTDATAATVARVSPAARLIQQPQGGPAAARNAGVARATADWIALLDHDDLWPAGRTEALVKAAAAATGAGLICGRVRINEMPGSTPDLRFRRIDNTVVPFLFQSGLIRRDIWIALGGMDTRLGHVEDVDFYLRLLEAGVSVVRIEAATVTYRRHGGNRTRDVDINSSVMLVAMRAAIARRRHPAGLP